MLAERPELAACLRPTTLRALLGAARGGDPVRDEGEDAGEGVGEGEGEGVGEGEAVVVGESDLVLVLRGEVLKNVHAEAAMEVRHTPSAQA